MSIKKLVENSIFSIVPFLLISFCAKTENILRGNGMNFIENKGQVVDMNHNLRPDVLFVGDANGNKAYLRKTGISYVLLENVKREEPHNDKNLEQPNVPPNLEKETRKGYRIDVDFIGGNTHPSIIKTDEVEGFNSYYYEHCPQGITNVKGYNKVTYQNVYNNVDVLFYGTKESGLKYDIVVKPGGNTNDIQLKYVGADNVKIENGKILLETSIGTITEWMPKVYQKINNEIIDIPASYALAAVEANTFILTYKIGEYDKNSPLIIDPSSAWITYQGGGDEEYCAAITVDNQSNSIVTGSSISNDFPVSAMPFITTNSGVTDVVVSKFSNSGARIWSIYYGSNDKDFGIDITHDSQGNCAILGQTFSRTLPTSANPFQSTTTAGGTFLSCYFLLKLDQNGYRVFCTYYSANNVNFGLGMQICREGNVVIDSANDIYISGITKDSVSTNSGPLVGKNNGFFDVFIAKFSPSGNFTWAQMYAGSHNDWVDGMAVDQLDNIIIAGYTKSADYPTVNPFQTVGTGFITKVDKNGLLLWSTYINGCYGIVFTQGSSFSPSDRSPVVITSTNDIVVVFTALSGFPSTLNSAPGGKDFGIIKLSASGTQIWGTYYGTSGEEWFPAATIDSNDNIYVFGEYEDFSTSITDNSCGYQNTFGGIEDHFISKFDQAGNLLCSTYLGGPNEEDWDTYSYGDIYAKGAFLYFTDNGPSGYPVTNGAFQTAFAGGSIDGGDLIIGRICSLNCGDDNYSDVTIDTTLTNTTCGVQVGFLPTHYCDPSLTSFTWQFQGATPSSSTLFNPTVTYNASGTYLVKLIISSPCGTDSISSLHSFVVANSNPTISGNNPICANTTSSLTITGVVSANWLPAASINNPSALTVVATPASTTTYTINGVSTQGCNYNTVYTVSVLTLPIISQHSNSSVTCNGLSDGAADITVSSGTTPYQYSWSDGSTNIGIINKPAATYTILVVDSAGCTATTTITITEPMPLTLAVTGNTVICSGQTTSISATANGGNGSYSYTWVPFNSNQQNVSVSLSSTTAYSVTVVDSTNCSATFSQNLAFHALPQLLYSLSDTAGCSPLCINFTNQSLNVKNIKWQYSDGAADTSLTAKHCFANAGKYGFDLMITDNNGCTNIIHEQNKLTIFPSPIAAFTASPTKATIINAQITVTNESQNATTYLWNWADGETSSDFNPNHFYSDTGKYCINLVTTNTFGCKDTAEQCIEITTDFSFYAPNAFTPNNDGVNETFNGYGIGIKEYQLWILDRWGEMIYTTGKTTSAENAIPWNGSVENGTTKAQQDVYIWKVLLKDAFDQSHSFIGHVSLIR
ncbi:MAG: gliding motility-associated C-terminal domain-containing protein [Bacteroidetes bacterium]|nr:gliding motility-associated C-terminal domain-containing protein [Bacteroidota bacterium]